MSDVKEADVRGEIKDDAETIRLMDHPDSTEEIPVLDMAPYLRDEPGGTQRVAEQLRDISKTVGFFYIKNHGISQALIDRVFEESRRFHALPEAVKEEVKARKIDTFESGYRGAGKERPYANVNIISDAKPNLYSAFRVNREGGSGGLSMTDAERAMERNVWPANLPGFKETVLDYLGKIENLGRQFLPLWAASLELPADYFEKYFATPHVGLTLLHYPPQKQIGNRQYGIAPHTDNAFMTFLAQANVSGLAVRMPSGHWRAVDIIPGTLLVNTGNVMVRWTNGEYLSTKHRVINTNAIDRYSIPVFFGPSGDAVVEVVPTCQNARRPPKFEPATYRSLRQWYYND
jgi:isopenicillin N synthase-like dioxygenase